jgi:APA family basic amino acid/polyamine antiporter
MSTRTIVRKCNLYQYKSIIRVLAMAELKRELGLFSTTLYGIGIILGAGIYALIGVGAGLAGNMLWFAFMLSALIAIFTGMSYAELSSRFPKEAAEYIYTKKAFNREMFSFMIGWLLVVGTVIAASTVALGFAGYFVNMFGGEPRLVAGGLIIVMTALNYIGIKVSATFNNFSSIIESAGLIIVIAVVFLFPPAHDIDYLELPDAGFPGILAAISVIFFAYIGFENVANLAEEVKHSREVVPKALLLSLAISTILYMLVSLAAVWEVGWEALSQSSAPITLVVSRILGPYAHLLSVIALFATANTVLIFLIASSRILYGMSHSGSMQGFFSTVGERGTPYFSVVIVGAVAVIAASFGDIKTVAQLSDIAVFIAYFAVNLALIALATSSKKGHFRTPRVAGIPVLAYLGAASAFFMLFQFEPELWALEVIVVLTGVVIYLLHKRVKQPA